MVWIQWDKNGKAMRMAKRKGKMRPDSVAGVPIFTEVTSGRLLLPKLGQSAEVDKEFARSRKGIKRGSAEWKRNRAV
jgi:hypothetical protein